MLCIPVALTGSWSARVAVPFVHGKPSEDEGQRFLMGVSCPFLHFPSSFART